MDAEIAMPVESAANRDGQTAHTHLYRRAVRNERRNVRRDALVNFIRLRIRQQNLIPIALGEHVDVACRHEGVLRGDGQPLIDLRDDAPCGGDERRDKIRHDTDGEVTGPGVRLYAQQQDVDTNRARAHERRHR